MTKKELQQIRHLNNEIRTLREHLAELEEQIGCGAIVQDGQPKGNKIGRPTEQQAINLADTIAIIQAHELELQNLKLRAWAFIASIEDSVIRQIVIMRFIDGKSWFKVSEGIGGNATEEGCRKAFERYFKETTDEPT